jgi:hypothetical protein
LFGIVHKYALRQTILAGHFAAGLFSPANVEEGRSSVERGGFFLGAWAASGHPLS